MINGATISFNPFVDEDVLFTSKDDANNFFSNLRVPVATQASYGSVKQAQTIVFNPTNLINSDSALINLDGVTAIEVPSKASFDELKNSYIALQASYNTLIQKLKQADIMV